jgi:WXG100 family type VII secretion target
MAEGFAGETAQFTKAHQDVEATKQSLDQQLNSLRSAIEDTRAGWKGPAKVKFDELMMRFDENATRLNKSLQGIGEQLQAAGSTYEAEEEAVSQQVTSITSRLDG